MDDETRHKLVWGGLRLFFGLMQMALAAASAVAVLTIGFRLLTWMFAGGALLAIIISRLIYHGREDPRSKGEKSK